jgi:hypothetical protein
MFRLLQHKTTEQEVEGLMMILLGDKHETLKVFLKIGHTMAVRSTNMHLNRQCPGIQLPFSNHCYHREKIGSRASVQGGVMVSRLPIILQRTAMALLLLFILGACFEQISSSRQATQPIKSVWQRVTAPGALCDPARIAQGLQRLFDATAAGRLDEADALVLRDGEVPQWPFIWYVTGAVGGGLSEKDPINQTVNQRAELRAYLEARAKQHDTIRLTSLMVASVYESGDVVGLSVGFIRQADDLWNRKSLLGVAKAEWYCPTGKLRMFAGHVLYDGQAQMRKQVQTLCPTTARRAEGILVCVQPEVSLVQRRL